MLNNILISFEIKYTPRVLKNDYLFKNQEGSVEGNVCVVHCPGHLVAKFRTSDKNRSS